MFPYLQKMIFGQILPIHYLNEFSLGHIIAIICTRHLLTCNKLQPLKMFGHSSSIFKCYNGVNIFLSRIVNALADVRGNQLFKRYILQRYTEIDFSKAVPLAFIMVESQHLLYGFRKSRPDYDLTVLPCFSFPFIYLQIIVLNINTIQYFKKIITPIVVLTTVVLNEKWYAMLDSKQSLRLKMAQITKRQNLRMAKSQVDVQTIIIMFLFERNITEDSIC